MFYEDLSISKEIVNEKKLIGSAQTRRKGIILQHGSIPFTIDADKLYRVLGVRKKEVRNKIKKKFLKKATAINQETDKDIIQQYTRKELTRNLVDIFNKNIPY